MKRTLKKSKIVMRTIEVKKAPKEPRWVIDPETGKKISRAGLAMRKSWEQGGLIEILDMDAVLK